MDEKSHRGHFVFIAFLIAGTAFLSFTCADQKNPESPRVSPHPDGWLNTVSLQFHGLQVETTGTKDCSNCHGDDFSGGYTEISCFSQDEGCHGGGPGGHPDGWMTLDDDNFHGEAIRSAGWNMDDCKRCHGTTYSGGTSDLSCNLCHIESPQHCNVCHGSEVQGVPHDWYFAPPEDLSGNHESSHRGVGAHQSHVAHYPCWTCHEVSIPILTYFPVSTHIDETEGAEVFFDPDSLSAQGTSSPDYHDDTGTCSGIYCHGFTLNAGGTDITPTWTDRSSALCGSCHDTDENDTSPQDSISVKGHLPNLRDGMICWDCHPANIDDTGPSDSTHVNGIIDLL
jgi:predicted CxxxxCH...CXXCH cytochrome family protein